MRSKRHNLQIDGFNEPLEPVLTRALTNEFLRNEQIILLCKRTGYLGKGSTNLSLTDLQEFQKTTHVKSNKFNISTKCYNYTFQFENGLSL